MALRLILIWLLAMVSFETARAQQLEKSAEKDSVLTSCDEFLPAKTRIGDKSVGPDECRIVSHEIVFNIKGQRFLRLEMRISGTVEGYAVKQGSRTEYFNDAPDFVFTQSGN